MKIVILDGRVENPGDLSWDGFRWIEPDDADRSMLTFLRRDRKGREILVVCNFCPVQRENVTVGLPAPCRLLPLLNTDDAAFGGSGTKLAPCRTRPVAAQGFDYSAVILSPPMSVSYYRLHKLPRRPISRVAKPNGKA